MASGDLNYYGEINSQFFSSIQRRSRIDKKVSEDYPIISVTRSCYNSFEKRCEYG